MKHLLSVVAVFTLSEFATELAPAQQITGTVSDLDGNPIQGMEVLFLDAKNALLAATATTTVSGTYRSGTIPTGNYRVRFLDANGAGVPGFFIPEFSGTNGNDDFCSSAVVTALPGSTTVVDESMVHHEPTIIVTRTGDVTGHVSAAETGASLGEMHVAVVDAANAWEVVTTTSRTDKDPGMYVASISQSPSARVRVRVSDPARNYFPEFFGPEGSDDFCAAARLEYEPPVKGIDVTMNIIPPGQVVDDLRDAIENLDLPTNVSNMLDQPLTQTVALLTDANPSNDAGVCGQLVSFISRVAIQETKGQLAPADAANLIQAAELARINLGC
jgi:Carboxypeptidase regulatory-like domain